MIDDDLLHIGDKIRQLRITRNLKQSELAYEAGVSERTLQRIEAGSVVKTDGLIKVIRQLGRWERLVDAIDSPGLSPYEMARHAKKATTTAALGEHKNHYQQTRKRVKRKPFNPTPSGKILWPEDQK